MFPKNHIPVIMLSAKSTQDDVLAGLDSGCVDYIKKPFLQNELLARVSTQLQLRNALKAQLQASLSDSLLQKILPLSIIHRLQSGRDMVADDHPSTSILFSDVVGFTKMSAASEPIEVGCDVLKVPPLEQHTSLSIGGTHAAAWLHSRSGSIMAAVRPT